MIKIIILSDFIARVNVESVIRAFSETVSSKVSDGEKFDRKGFLLEEIKDFQIIAEIVKRRYDNDKLTYGFQPKYKFRNSRRYETGQVCVNADIRDNLISDIKFSGDFIALRNISELQNRLNGLIGASNDTLKRFLIN